MKTKRFKALVMIMVMVMALTGSVPTVEAKTKTSITVTNKTTGKKVGKKVTMKAGEKIQLKVKYGKKVITKKAKYKTSNKSIATVSKKGKITAKSAGTCTVKVTYKKAVKKVKVVVKAVNTTTEEPSTNGEYSKYWTKEMEQGLDNLCKKYNWDAEEREKRKQSMIQDKIWAEEKKKPIDQNRINQYIESCQLYSDPHPECDHVWDPVFWSDLYSINPDNFASLCNEHLTLRELVCPKCGCHAVTVPTPFPESKHLTSDEYAKLIDHYRDHTKMTLEQAPHHKHKKVRKYYALPCNHRMYSDEPECEICGAMFNE